MSPPGPGQLPEVGAMVESVATIVGCEKRAVRDDELQEVLLGSR